MSKLPIRVLPLPGESQAGYLLRLAMQNGFTNPKDIVAQSVLNRAKRNTLSDDDIHNISLLIRRPITFSENEDSFFSKVCSKSRLHHARVCTSCIQDNPVHQDHWQDPRNTHCKEHDELLIDVCKSCKQQLDFKVNLFQGFCNNENCGRKLQAHTVAKRIKDLSHEDKEDCIIAGLYALEIVSELKKKTYFSYQNVPAILKAGIGLLTDDDALQRWLLKTSSQGLPHQYPVNLAFSRLYSLSRHVKNSWGLLDRAHAIRKEINVKNTFKSPIVEMRLLALCLGLSPQDLKPLWYRNVLRFTNCNHYQADALIDSGPLVRLLITKSSSDIKDAVSFLEAASYVDQYLMEKSDLLIAMMNDELPFQYVGNDSLLDSVTFSRSKLKEIGERHLELTKTKTIRVDECEKIAGLSSSKVERALKTGKIRSSGWKADNSTLKLVELLKLKEQHNNRQLNMLFDKD